MRYGRALATVLMFSLSVSALFGRETTDTEQNTHRPCFLGSTLFLLGNVAPGDPPYFLQINFGYHVSPRDVLVLEAITWTYYEPLGTYGSSEEEYPGKIRAAGVGIGYQRFFWKGLYSTIQATPFFQQFYNEEDERIQGGFQLFLQLRLGYRFQLFRERWFIEPSVAFNYWPINTNFPESFSAVEDDAPNYYLFEPGLHFGFRF